MFSDHFTGPAGARADAKWVYDIGTQYNGTGCPSRWGTSEVETGTASTANVHQDGHGHLLITPMKSGGGWTSGRIETVSSRFAAPAGGELKVIASIRQPVPASGLGYWPAFWMLGAGFRAGGGGTSGTMNCTKWPSVGEVDIMEDVNALSQQAGTLHCGTAPGGPCNEFTGQSSGLQPCPRCQSGYHTYSVVVDRRNTSSESITWYLDGNAYFTVTESQVGAAAWKAAVDHGFFLILDVAMGGGFPNAVCSCSTPTTSTTSGAAMGVRYVAVYVRRLSRVPLNFGNGPGVPKLRRAQSRGAGNNSRTAAEATWHAGHALDRRNSTAALAMIRADAPATADPMFPNAIPPGQNARRSN